MARPQRAAGDTAGIENMELLDVNGEPVRLGSLWEDGPVVLVWLRHYGWTHCRHYAVQLNRAQEEINAAGARLVFIGQATPRHAAHFQRRYAPDVEILADEDRASYKGMGLRRASVGQLLGPRSVMKGLTRTVTDGSLTVQGRIIGDAAQLGGTFIVLPTGEIAWSHLSKDASDNAELPELLEALTDALAWARVRLGTRSERQGQMTLVVHCECGANPSGETEDEVVEAVQAHKAEAHPEITEDWSREQILSMAHEH